MGAATGKSASSKVASSVNDHESPISEKFRVDAQPDRPLLVRDPAESSDYITYLARATNDAVRDWDVTSASLSWRQGLDSLFGFVLQPSCETISFWEQRLHP